MTIITEIDLKFKSGNGVAVQDVRLTREEWAQVKAYIDGVKSGKPTCSVCGKQLVTNPGEPCWINGMTFIKMDNGACMMCDYENFLGPLSARIASK